MECPVIVRGVLYPSQAAAARALGVVRSTIFFAAERGTLDNVGKKRKPVQINGVRYGSITEAAEANGVTRSYLSNCKYRGISDTRVGHFEWDVE